MEIAFLALRILMAFVLYAFLGWLIWLQWGQLKVQIERAVVNQFPELRLSFGGHEPEVFRSKRQEVIIGRQPGCDLRLEDGTISARHTRLSYHDGQWWAADLHSRNGTFLNENPLTSPVVLAGGDVLRCGSVPLQILIESDSIAKPEY